MAVPIIQCSLWVILLALSTPNSALPTASATGQVSSNPPGALCQPLNNAANSTLSLSINRTSHAVAAEVFDSSCSSLGDAVTFPANASNITVQTTNGELVIASIGSSSSGYHEHHHNNHSENTQGDLPKRKEAQDSGAFGRRGANRAGEEHYRREPSSCDLGIVNGYDLCTGQSVSPGAGTAPNGGSTKDLPPQARDAGQEGEDHYRRQVSRSEDHKVKKQGRGQKNESKGVQVNFSVNGTSLELTLGASGECPCSSGGKDSDSSADGCAQGVLCCRCSFGAA